MLWLISKRYAEKARIAKKRASSGNTTSSNYRFLYNH
mgnify:CR=1 FL=1